MTDTSNDASVPQSPSEQETSDEALDAPEQEDPAPRQEQDPASPVGEDVEKTSDNGFAEDDGASPGDDPASDEDSASDDEDAPQNEGTAESEDAGGTTDPGYAPDSASPNPTSPDSSEQPAPQTTGQIRLSRPTPTLPPAVLSDQEEPGLSDFFDQIDEKVSTATGRIAAAFRRPTGEEPPPVDRPEQEPGDIDVVDAHGIQAPAPGAPRLPRDAGSPQDEGPGALEPLPGDELPPPPPPAPPAQRSAAGRSAHGGSALQPADAAELEREDLEAERSEEDRLIPPPQESRPAGQLSFPAPPSRAEANRGRRDLDEDRRREVIWEKASAIEAATTPDYDWPEQDYADDEDDLYTYIPPYNLPSRDPDPPAQRSDLHRQILVSLGALAAVVTSVWMFGAFDGPAILGGGGLGELAEGWFSGDQALLSPDDGFYWLWPLITLGLIGHAVHQWTTAQTSTPRQRRSGWLVGFASLMVLGWTAAVHAGIITLAALAALAAALALVDSLRQFNFHTARNSMERRLTDATVGLFAGWALVTAMSSVSVWLTALGIRIPGIPAVLWALIGLVVCIWVAAFYSMTERGRITVALGMGWGMFWLIFPRLLSEVPSVWVAIGAAMGAFIVILATESRRHRINHAERRAAMGRPVEDII